MKKGERIHLRYLFLFLLSLIILSGGVISTAYATNGYFANGYSIESKGLGGAGVALPQGSLDASINPAAMAFVGNRLDLGLAMFNPNRKYTVEGNPSGFPGTVGLAPGTQDSHRSWFFIPSLGANWQMDNKNSIGISMFGNGGMNTDYRTNTFGFSPTGVDLMQLFITPTYARKIESYHAIGISPIFAYQRFAAKGLQAFSPFSSHPDSLTDNDHNSSVGYGVRFGYLGEILPFLNIGASYQTKILMSKFHKYDGLFAEEGSFDIPSTWTIGIAVKITPDWTFLMDVQEINYSDIKAIHNPLLPNLMQAQLGSDNGAGFGWDDITVLKLGVQWKSSKDWTWRAGYSIGDQPIPRSEVLFNILAPGVVKQHATFGVTRTIGNNELKLALMHAIEHTVSGTNPLDPVQRIKLTMNQWEVSIGYAWKF